MPHRCKICREVWDDFYDAKSHVYTSHEGDRCGFTQTDPELFVGEVSEAQVQ